VTAVAEATRDRRRKCMMEKGEAEEADKEQHSRLIPGMLEGQYYSSRETA